MTGFARRKLTSRHQVHRPPGSAWPRKARSDPPTRHADAWVSWGRGNLPDYRSSDPRDYVGQAGRQHPQASAVRTPTPFSQVQTSMVPAIDSCSDGEEHDKECNGSADRPLWGQDRGQAGLATALHPMQGTIGGPVGAGLKQSSKQGSVHQVGINSSAYRRSHSSPP